MRTPLQRIFAAIGSVARSDEPIEVRRASYRRTVEEVTADLDRDELVKLAHDLGAMLESRFK